MISHQEYVDQSDEDQLADLITRAQARIAGIQESGWVKLWTVSIGAGNDAWFAESDRDAAVDWACKAVKQKAAAHPTRAVEMEVSLERYRPEEVDELLRHNAKSKQEQS